MHVVVCAPASEQSTTSHALSLHRPLRLTRLREDVYCVDGTPADCVYVALHSKDRILKSQPKLVLSGLNHGPNLGDDVFYSGTVAAAREGALRGIPAIAASCGDGADMETSARYVAALARRLCEAPLRGVTLLNLNFPAGDGWQVVSTRLGRRIYNDAVEFRADPRGREYLWIGGAGVRHTPAPGSDTEAFDEGLVGVTPLVLDLWLSSGQEEIGELLQAVDWAN